MLQTDHAGPPGHTMTPSDPSSSPRPLAASLGIGLLLATVASAAIGGVATAQGVQTWYPALDKPPWTPPNWAFGPVWTALYLAMTAAAWDVARGRWSEVRRPMALYAAQLSLNTLWSPVFFGAQQFGLGLLILSVLWFNIIACIVAFRTWSPLAAVCLVPYLLWVSIAWSLNAWICWYN